MTMAIYCGRNTTITSKKTLTKTSNLDADMNVGAKATTIVFPELSFKWANKKWVGY